MGRPRKTASYTAPDGKQWVCLGYPALRKDFPEVDPILSEFHQLYAEAPVWDLLRRHYGLNPENDGEIGYEPMPVDRIASQIGITVDEIEDDLRTARNEWQDFLDMRGQGEEAGKILGKPEPIVLPLEPPKAPEPPGDPAENDKNLEITRQFGFDDSMFDLAGRSPFAQAAELRWFATRLESLRKAFEQPMAVGIARQAIINELFLRRCDDDLMHVRPSEFKLFGAIHDTKNRIEQIYLKQWEQLESICPFVKALATKVSMTGCLSDVIKGHREWKAHGSHELLDGLFDSLGIQIEERQSVQNPTPRYRPGWVAAQHEARDGLWDQKWQQRLPHHILQMMDETHAAIATRMVEQGGIKLTDLESTGQNSEYATLVVPPEEDKLPEDSVPIDEGPGATTKP